MSQCPAWVVVMVLRVMLCHLGQPATFPCREHVTEAQACHMRQHVGLAPRLLNGSAEDLAGTTALNALRLHTRGTDCLSCTPRRETKQPACWATRCQMQSGCPVHMRTYMPCPLVYLRALHAMWASRRTVGVGARELCAIRAAHSSLCPASQAAFW